MSVVGEEARLAAVHSYRLLDAPRPVVLDELTRLASALFETPMASVTLVDRDRQWYAGNTGLEGVEDPRSMSFCSRVVEQRSPLIVRNALEHPVFHSFANVLGAPFIRSYAGAPLVDEDGFVLGAVCVIDNQIRELGDRRIDLLTDLAGQAAGHLSAIRNRTLLAEVGDELSRAISREEDFVATVSHELRTPVTTIQGYLELLVDNEELAPYQKLIEPIQRNGERLVRMVDHLLAGTRPDGTPMSMLQARLDLVTIVEAAIAACRGQITQRQATIELVRPAAPVLLAGDFTRLAQAVEHLVRNALFFTPVGATVTVRVHDAGVEVSDEGAGIPADELPYVVERFYRGRYAREQAVPGVGLGLSIADRIARAHNGALEVTSAGVDAGVTARLKLG